MNTGVHQPQLQLRRPEVLPHHLPTVGWRIVPDDPQRPRMLRSRMLLHSHSAMAKVRCSRSCPVGVVVSNSRCERTTVRGRRLIITAPCCPMLQGTLYAPPAQNRQKRPPSGLQGPWSSRAGWSVKSWPAASATPVQQLPHRVPVELHPGTPGRCGLHIECSFPWGCGADRARDSLLPAGPPGKT